MVKQNIYKIGFKESEIFITWDYSEHNEDCSYMIRMPSVDLLLSRTISKSELTTTYFNQILSEVEKNLPFSENKSEKTVTERAKNNTNDDKQYKSHEKREKIVRNNCPKGEYIDRVEDPNEWTMDYYSAPTSQKIVIFGGFALLFIGIIEQCS